MSGETKLNTERLACLTRLEDAHTVLSEQRSFYLTQARLKTREARTQQSFAKLEMFPTARTWGFRVKRLELEAEAEHLRARATALDDLLRQFASRPHNVGGQS